MIKLALFDIDGVLNNGERFSKRYSTQFGVSLETLLEFFNGSYKKCVIGEADLKDELLKVKDKWKFKGSVDELLDFWFSGEVNEVKEVREFILELKNKGINTASATNQEKLRIEYLTKTLNLNEIFNEIYCSARIGLKKPDTKFFKYISNDLSIPFEETILWDDSQTNIDSAKSLGINAFLFEGFDKMKKQFEITNHGK